MFPDSAIAQEMKCGPTKLSIITTFGLAPYLNELLLVELQEAPCFVISFDELLNQELQQEKKGLHCKVFQGR